ncbi:hypothetical protein K435DRAFT_594271, partial [Dendrothele bispora CBS 962.96]
ISQILAFVLLCSHLKCNILLLYPSRHPINQVPSILPRETRIFLGESCNMDDKDVEACWDAVKDVVWAEDTVFQAIQNDEAVEHTFQKHGRKLYPSPRSLWPPNQYCINIECPYVKANKNLKLQQVSELNGILYTVSMGPIAVRIYQMTCEGCKIVYHPDYFVKKDPDTNERSRHYYDATMPPGVLQVATHHFVETALSRMWRNHMLYGATSAGNCAKVYMRMHSRTACIPSEWTVQASLRSDYVYDAFKILSLLEYHHSRGTHLSVPQTIDQAYRFDAEMLRVNEEIRKHGQPEINHWCEKCVRTVVDNGKAYEIFAVICDGVTVGRPCCGVPHCKGQLKSTQDVFCIEHDAKRLICRVTGCERRIKSTTSQTCDLLDHQAAEARYRDEEKAVFQLKLRYERARRADEQANLDWDFGNADLDTGSDAVFQAVVETGKGAKKQKSTVRAQFGRRWTHNEQLIIAPCGTILARETFYFSEAFSAVAQLVRDTFEGRRKPNHFIFDCNCILSKYVRKHIDPATRDFFEDIGLAVDVFHFKCKHSEKDTYC